MGKESGITIIALVITIVLIIILTGVTIYSGISAYDEARKIGFEDEMTIIQEKVNTEYINIKNGKKQVTDYGKSIEQAQGQKEIIDKVLNGKDVNNFRYLDENSIKYDLGIDGIKQKVVIDFNSRQVYSLIGVKYNGEMYYSKYDLPNATINENYNNIENQIPKFQIEKLNYGLYTTINIKNIKYPNNVNGGRLYYGQIVDDSQVEFDENQNITTNTMSKLKVDYWQEIASQTINIEKSGKYAIKLVDKANNQSIKVLSIALLNSPEITDEIVPVIYDEQTSRWRKVNENEMGLWYDYSGGNWANAMLKEGLEIYDETDDENLTGYIKTQTDRYVWVPRYAYRVKDDNTEVKFLKDATNISTDLTNIKIGNETTNYSLPAVFNNKTDKGIWVKEDVENETINYLNNSQYGPLK